MLNLSVRNPLHSLLASRILLIGVFVTVTALRDSSASDDLLALDAERNASRAVAILNSKCIACHGPEKSAGGLRLDSHASVLRGGDQGAALVAGESQESLVMRSIRDPNEETRMPPKNPLSGAEIDAIARWIEEGAKWPSAESSAKSRMLGLAANSGNAWEDPQNPIRKLFGGERLDLWSLRPIERPPVPQVEQAEWSTNAIDNFVLAEWEQQPNAKLADEANRRTLAIRTALDLTGLPPTFSELDTFVTNSDPRAYERWVERLLGHPSYGVRWARMWLDVVRYSDSNGFDWDEFRPQAWKFRDYVVEAWNADLPFDQFTFEQLAGDELVRGPPADTEEQRRLIATGYLRVGPHDNSSPLFNEQDRSRAQLLADLTETTGSAFLGLTLGCCRCHDHKTDPLSHADHYRLRAFFAAVEFADDLPLDLPVRRSEIEQQNASIDQQIATLAEQIAAIHLQAKERLKLTAAVADPTEKDVKKSLVESEQQRVKELSSQKSELAKQKLAFAHGLLMRDKPQEVPVTYVLFQGDHKAPREAVTAGFPSVLAPGEVAIAPPGENSTGRRSALAEWIVARNNPWTARVIVNRLWQGHFGEGLVATPNDFGITGARPSNVALLDWLASELIDSGWSIKHVQRLIVTSSVYRQATLRASADSDASEIQATPQTLRTQLRRLEAELLRDRILHASNLIDHRIGGPPVWPKIPAEILQTNPAFLDDNATKTKGWYPSPADQQAVRSLFLVQKRTIRIPFLETFDLPDNSVSCARRESSLVAPQALALLNSEQVEQASLALAKLIADETMDVELQVQRVFQRTLLRSPSLAEHSIAEEFVRSRSLAELCRVLLNTNEFAFVD